MPLVPFLELFWMPGLNVANGASAVLRLEPKMLGWKHGEKWWKPRRFDVFFFFRKKMMFPAKYDTGDMGWLSLNLPNIEKYTWGEVLWRFWKFQESWRICWRCRLCRVFFICFCWPWKHQKRSGFSLKCCVLLAAYFWGSSSLTSIFQKGGWNHQLSKVLKFKYDILEWNATQAGNLFLSKAFSLSCVFCYTKP